ncbi:MAG: hypothetical protein M3436_20940 [Pseudomonadota bacterium]|nr:hypothetical protein [Pseudomonadota bacterium]
MKRLIFTLAVLTLAYSATQAGSYVDKLNDLMARGATLSDNDGGLSAVGARYFGKGGIQLVRNMQGRQGALTLPDLDPGTAISAFTAEVEYVATELDTSGTGMFPQRGTGMGFVFGSFPALMMGADMQGPINLDGLAVGFDTNYDGSPAGIRVFVDGVLIAVNETVNPATTDFARYRVVYDANGLDVLLNTNTAAGFVPVFTDLDLGAGFTPAAGDRFALTASCDDNVNRIIITDIKIQTTP